MKTLNRLLPLLGLTAALVLAPSESYGLIIREIMDFSTYPNLPVSLTGDLERAWDYPPPRMGGGIWVDSAVIDSSGMTVTEISRPGIYISEYRITRFELKPNGTVPAFLIGFGLVCPPSSLNPTTDHPTLPELHHLYQAPGAAWSWSDVPAGLPDVPTVFADPGSYIKRYASLGDWPGYSISEIELFWYVPDGGGVPPGGWGAPDGGSVFLPFLVTLVLLLGGHKLSRVDGLAAG